MSTKPKLDIDLSREQLEALGLVHAAAALEQTLSAAVKQATSAHGFLEQLLRSELDERDQRRGRTSLRLSNLPTAMTLADFDFACQPSVERSRIETLATGAWVRASETLLIQRPSGAGKTHLAVGLGMKAIEHGFSVQFYRFDELLVALRADAVTPPNRLRRKKYVSSALLIIDELGFEPMGREEASLLFRLVSYRHGRDPILITTNKSVRDWTELLAGDEALTTAILDRLLHNAHVINIKGRSYRLRDLANALASREG